MQPQRQEVAVGPDGNQPSDLAPLPEPSEAHAGAAERPNVIESPMEDDDDLNNRAAAAEQIDTEMEASVV